MICKENQNGVCLMEYLPAKAGAYDIAIKYADEEVPGSPFRVLVEDQVDASKVSVQMPKKTCRVNVPANVLVDARSAGKGEPKLELCDPHGRVKPVPLMPQIGHAPGDGLYSANIVPGVEGLHRLDVKWNGSSVPNR